MSQHAHQLISRSSDHCLAVRSAPPHAPPSLRTAVDAAVITALALACLAAMPCRAADVVIDCQTKTDAQERLACYDARFPVQTTPPAAAAPAASAPSPDEVAGPTPQEASPTSSTPLPSGIGNDTLLSRFWEMADQNQRETFVVKTYQPNYLLPLHYTSSINREPFSPTRGQAPSTPNYSPVEAKYQISLRAKVAHDLFFPHASLWLAYTQQSMWQVWNHADSAPFRNTDYQPEIIYVTPLPQTWTQLPHDWQWRFMKLGLAHQSNGQSDPLSRSWNRVYAETAFERKDLSVQMRFNQRVFQESGDQDDNPDIARYMGDAEARVTWLPGRSTVNLTWRMALGSFRSRAVQLDWTYPVFKDKPEGLRWYVQMFSGYGETLLDYNHPQNSIGLGFSLFQF